MKVGIIGGTGRMGRMLARQLARENNVVIGSRDARRAEQVAGGIEGAEGTDYEGACRKTDIAIFAIPYSAMGETAPLSGALAGKVVISVINPIKSDGGFLRFPLAEGSAAQELARLIPGARVATAFNHISPLFFEKDRLVPMDILVAADEVATYEQVAVLVKSVPSLRPLYVGPLSESRVIEMMTPMMLNIARFNKTGSLATKFASTKDAAR